MLIKNIKIMQNLVQNFKFLQERKVLKKTVKRKRFLFLSFARYNFFKIPSFFRKMSHTFKVEL